MAVCVRLRRTSSRYLTNRQRTSVLTSIARTWKTVELTGESWTHTHTHTHTHSSQPISAQCSQLRLSRTTTHQSTVTYSYNWTEAADNKLSHSRRSVSLPRSTVQLSCRPTWQPRLSQPACLPSCQLLPPSYSTDTLSHHNVSPTPIKPTIKHL